MASSTLINVARGSAYVVHASLSSGNGEVSGRLRRTASKMTSLLVAIPLLAPRPFSDQLSERCARRNRHLALPSPNIQPAVNKPARQYADREPRDAASDSIQPWAVEDCRRELNSDPLAFGQKPEPRQLPARDEKLLV